MIGAGGALVLIAAIILQFGFRWREVPNTGARPDLAKRLNAEPDGWQVVEERLGPTEGVAQAVLKTLNLDDYVYRRFRRGAVQFSVYAAYWGPGKMPTRLVASHTPDRCWTENGMRCVDMRFRERLTLEGRALLPAEVRTFLPPSGAEPTYVAYWHTVEGRLYDYGARFNAVPHPWLWWKDTAAQVLYGSREQLFVRITSSQPLAEIWREPGFQRVMAQVAALGLYAGGAAAGP